MKMAPCSVEPIHTTNLTAKCTQDTCQKFSHTMQKEEKKSQPDPWVGFDDLWQKYVQAEKSKANLQKERAERLRLKRYRWMKTEERRRRRGVESKEEGWKKGDSLEKANQKRALRCYEIEDRSTFKVWRVQMKLHMFEMKNVKVICDGQRVKVSAEKKDKEGIMENKFAWIFEPYPWTFGRKITAAWNPRRGILLLESTKKNPLHCRTFYRPIALKKG